MVQVASKEGETTSKQDEGLPEYVLKFHPPIVVHNLLPYPITVTLTDARSTKSGGVAAQVGTWNIRVGGSEDVYFFDLTKKLKMGVEMKVRTCNDVYINVSTVQALHDLKRQHIRSSRV